MDTFAIRRMRLKYLVDTIANGNVSVFAGRFGYSAAQVSQYLSSNYNGGRSMGERAARALEAKASIPQGWLDQPFEPVDANHPRAAYAAADSMADARGPRLQTVPIRWHATTESEGLVEMREVKENHQWVEAVVQSPNAFAVRIKGHDLKPRIRSGEVFIVEPTRKPAPGDDVLVHLQSGEFMVLQYLYTRDDELVLGPINEDGVNAHVPDSEIVDMSVITTALRQSAMDIPEQKS
jgi:SOS-response transcriptional repressor LexA